MSMPANGARAGVATMVCKNCGTLIGALETAYVYGDQPVCQVCFERLRGKKVKPIFWAVVGAAVMGIIAAVSILIFVNTRPQKVSREHEPLKAERLDEDPAIPEHSEIARPPSPPSTLSEPIQGTVPPSVREQFASQRQPRSNSAPPSVGTVRGTAWINKEDGSSNLQRGLRITLLNPKAGRQSVAKCLNVIAATWQKDIDDNMNRAAESRKRDKEAGIADLESWKIWEEAANASKRGLAAVKDAVQHLPKDMDVSDAMTLITKLSQYNIPQFGPIVTDCSIKETRTDPNGKYVIDNVPTGDYYVHALIDTKAFLIEWVVPVQVDGKSVKETDIYNENAAVIRNAH